MISKTHATEGASKTLLMTDDLPCFNPWEGIRVTPISGDEHGLDGMSIILAETEPGGQVPLHSHPYQEIFIVSQGTGRWTVGEIEYDAGAGDIVIAPVDAPHKFVNAGGEVMRHTSIQLSGKLGAALHRNPIADMAMDAGEIEG